MAMFYLSELIGKPVLDRQGNRIARVRDVVAELTQTSLPADEDDTEQRIITPDEAAQERAVPALKGLCARTSRKNDFFLPIEQVETLGPSGASLRSSRVSLRPFERRAGEMLLTRDLWDKQVIDLESHRVVRVNDIVISEASQTLEQSEDAPEALRWWVRGVDVGIGGIIRRVRLTRPAQAVSKKLLLPNIVRWQHLDVFGSNVPGGVLVLHEKLASLHPVEIARITDSVSYHQGAEIIASLDDTLAADTLEELVAERQTDIVEHIPEERAADILEEMSPDEATDLLAELPEEKASALLEQMDKEDAEEIRQLMRYSEHTAGGMMTTDFLRVPADMTVREVIESNRSVFLSADLIYYLYVINSEEENELVGIITVRDLLVHKQDETVGDFMLKEFISVRPGEKNTEVARKMAEYNLLALPVVEKNGTLLGVVTVDDALDALLPEGWQKRLPKIFS
jgi:magnesium transporter